MQNRSETADFVAELRLFRTPGVGASTYKRLINRTGSAAEALKQLPDRIGEPVSEAEIARELELSARLGLRYVSVNDAEYPKSLRELEDSPPIFLVKGDISTLSKPCIGVVGARNATLNGRKFAQNLAFELAQAGFCVVSGLARGIDGSAHEGALAGGNASTIAVVAGGIDVIYPPEHSALCARISETSLLLSEMPPGTEPKAALFPRRNRIVSGLSLGVVVVEATLKSGSLITARFAAEQGREVFAVPGSPLDPRAAGPNALIRDGATLIQSAADIISEFTTFNAIPKDFSHDRQIPKQAFEKTTETDIEKARGTVLEALGPTPVSVDELGRRCHVTPAVLAMVLLELELAGRLERLPGNRVALVGTV